MGYWDPDDFQAVALLHLDFWILSLLLINQHDLRDGCIGVGNIIVGSAKYKIHS